MRWLHGRGLLGWGCLLLAACTTQPVSVSPADAVARLRTGAPLLRCREACVAAWQQAQPQAAQLAAGGRWADLAALTIEVGYQDDLSLYYLGEAAERLGYPAAAASYYRQSTYVTGTTIACRNLSRACGGLSFPQAALARLAAIERSIAPPRPRRSPPSMAPQPETPAAPAPAEPPPPPVWAQPEPMASVEPAPAPPPPPSPPLPDLAPPPLPLRAPPPEFIEPPPAPR